jgi:hypothetical protein
MAASRQLGAPPRKSLQVLAYGTMACLFAPDGMDSAEFGQFSALFPFPTDNPNSEEIAKWQCLPMTS